MNTEPRQTDEVGTEPMFPTLDAPAKPVTSWRCTACGHILPPNARVEPLLGGFGRSACGSCSTYTVVKPRPDTREAAAQ
jgi:DNA-directed RNA polymerase subunit RPC12/RpoP